MTETSLGVDAKHSELVRILAAHTASLAATLEDFTGAAATSLQPGLKRTLDFLGLYREQLLAGQLSAEMRRLLDQLAAGVRRPGDETPCGPEPDQCDAESGEPCADHERQQAHAEGEHAFCGDECAEAGHG